MIIWAHLARYTQSQIGSSTFYTWGSWAGSGNHLCRYEIHQWRCSNRVPWCAGPSLCYRQYAPSTGTCLCLQWENSELDENEATLQAFSAGKWMFLLYLPYRKLPARLSVFVRRFRRVYKRRGLYPRRLTIGIEKDFKTSYGSADQNTFCSYWFLIKLQNVTIDRVHFTIAS